MTIFRFKDFQFDDQSNQLTHKLHELHLQPKAAQLLAFFLNHRGEILAKETLLEAVWSETAVTEHVLFQCLKKLRAVLKQDEDGTFIKTYPGQGYQWVHDTVIDTAKKRRPYQAIVLSGVAVVLSLILIVRLQKDSDQTVTRQSIAVADFKDLSANADQEWYGIAIAEILRADLASKPSLRLISGESTARAGRELGLSQSDSHAPETMQVIRNYLGNDYWIGGSYLVEGDRLRLNLIFQETQKGSVVFSASKTGATSEFLSLVNDIANAVAKQMGETGDDGLEEVLVADILQANPEAARSYLLGLRSLRRQAYRESIAYFELALASDPNSSLILSRLAQAWTHLGYIPKAQQYAKQALAHAQELPVTEKLIVQAVADKSFHHWAVAAGRYQTLFTLYPDEPEYGLMLAESLIEDGVHDRAIIVLDQLSRHAGIVSDPRIALLRARAARLQATPSVMVENASKAIEQAKVQGSISVEAEALLLNCEGQRRLGNLKDAFEAAEKARVLYVSLDDQHGFAESLLQTGNTHMQTGQYDEAEASYKRAREVKESIGQKNGLGSVLNNLGAIAYHRGQLDQAHEFFSSAKEAFEFVDDKKRTANALINLGIIQVANANFDTAFDHYQNADVLYRSIGNVDGQYRVVHSLATLFHSKGDPQSALSQLERAVDLVRENHLNAELTRTLLNYGMTQRQLLDLGGARNSLAEAVSLAISQGQSRLAGASQFRLGELLLHFGDHEKAASTFIAAAQSYREVDDEPSARMCLAWRYIVNWETGSFESDSWNEFLHQPDVDIQQEADVLIILARMEIEDGNSASAVKHMQTALQLVLKKHDKHHEITTRRWLVEALISDHQIDEALIEYESASVILNKANFPFEALMYQITEAKLLRRQDNVSAAIRPLETLCHQLADSGLYLLEIEAQILRARIACEINQLADCERANKRSFELTNKFGFTRLANQIPRCEQTLIP